MTIDLVTGEWQGDGTVSSCRTLGELASHFESPIEQESAASVVYKTFGHKETGGECLLLGTTVLFAGRVGDEFWMTRGHFHTNPSRGETCVTLSGQGVLLLANRQGQHTTENMTTGSVHTIDGNWAHRVVNVGQDPLVFLVSWMSDCGHDYATIEEHGFPVRIVQSNSGWTIRTSR